MGRTQQVGQPGGRAKGHGLHPESPKETVQNLLGKASLPFWSCWGLTGRQVTALKGFSFVPDFGSIFYVGGSLRVFPPLGPVPPQATRALEGHLTADWLQEPALLTQHWFREAREARGRKANPSENSQGQSLPKSTLEANLLAPSRLAWVGEAEGHP